MSISRIVDTAAAVAVILASGVVTWSTAFKVTPARVPTPSRPTAVEKVDIAAPATLIGEAPVKGQANAPLLIAEFTDFQCPFCGEFARDVLPRIDQDLVKSGKAKLVVHNFPLESIHPRAMPAAIAAECAGNEGRYWDMHDLLFGDQKKLSDEDIETGATFIGLNRDRFAACLHSRQTKRLGDDHALGSALGVSSTPTFFVGRVQINGSVRVVRKITGAQPYLTFKAVIDELLTTKST
jgi:protein-disulfide isomerase